MIRAFDCTAYVQKIEKTDLPLPTDLKVTMPITIFHDPMKEVTHQMYKHFAEGLNELVRRCTKSYVAPPTDSAKVHEHQQGSHESSHSEAASKSHPVGHAKKHHKHTHPKPEDFPGRVEQKRWMQADVWMRELDNKRRRFPKNELWTVKRARTEADNKAIKKAAKELCTGYAEEMLLDTVNFEENLHTNFKCGFADRLTLDVNFDRVKSHEAMMNGVCDASGTKKDTFVSDEQMKKFVGFYCPEEKKRIDDVRKQLDELTARTRAIEAKGDVAKAAWKVFSDVQEDLAKQFDFEAQSCAVSIAVMAIDKFWSVFPAREGRVKENADKWMAALKVVHFMLQPQKIEG